MRWFNVALFLLEIIWEIYEYFKETPTVIGLSIYMCGGIQRIIYYILYISFQGKKMTVYMYV